MDKGLIIRVISRGPGVETIVQKIRIEKPFMLPKPQPPTPKN